MDLEALAILAAGCVAISQAPFALPCLPEALANNGLTWKIYGEPSYNYFNHLTALKGSPRIVTWVQFDADVAASDLPNIAWVYATSEFDEHPPFGSNAGKPVVTAGMQWTVDRVTQISRSALWSSTVIFITWDDWRGWADHVEPPLRDKWKNGGPAGSTYANTQFSYGPRVGCLVLSPYTRPGFISRTFHSRMSLVKFCVTTFGLASINARDAASENMSDCFDHTQPPLAPLTSSLVPAPGPRPDPKTKHRKNADKGSVFNRPHPDGRLGNLRKPGRSILNLK